MNEIRYLASSTHQNQPRLLILSLLRSPTIKVLQRDIIVRLEALHVLHSESSQAVSWVWCEARRGSEVEGSTSWMDLWWG
jgi:hypothetical protein